MLKNGTPAKAIVKSFAMPSTTEKFAMQIDLEVHPPGGAPYLITYVYPSARQKAAMSVGMEVPVKYLPDDPARVAVQWDALKGSIAAAGGDMAAVMGGLQSTYSGTADAAMRQAMSSQAAQSVPSTMPGGTSAPVPPPAPAAGPGRAAQEAREPARRGRDHRRGVRRQEGRDPPGYLSGSARGRR